MIAVFQNNENSSSGLYGQSCSDEGGEQKFEPFQRRYTPVRVGRVTTLWGRPRIVAYSTLQFNRRTYCIPSFSCYIILYCSFILFLHFFE